MPVFELFVYLFALSKPRTFLVCMAIILYCLWHAFGGHKPDVRYYDGTYTGTRILTWHAWGAQCAGAGPVSFTLTKGFFQFPIVEGRDPEGRQDWVPPGSNGYVNGVFGDHTFEGRITNGIFDAKDDGPKCTWRVRAIRAAGQP